MKNSIIIIALLVTLFLISCQDQKGVDVNSVDLQPVVRINSPEYLTSTTPGNKIFFEAEFFTIDETEQDWIATWESDKDGILFSENLDDTTISSFITDSLSDSLHTITVSFSNESLIEPAQKHVIVENNLPVDLDYSQFSYLGYQNEKQYFISEFWEIWTAADSISVLNGGHLVTITSEAENEFLEDVMLSYNVGSKRDSVEASTIWLGLKYNSNSTYYEWVTGEEFDYYFGANYYYNDFMEDPSSQTPYVYIRNLDSEWRISENEIKRRFILERELGEVE